MMPLLCPLHQVFCCKSLEKLFRNVLQSLWSLIANTAINEFVSFYKIARGVLFSFWVMKTSTRSLRHSGDWVNLKKESPTSQKTHIFSMCLFLKKNPVTVKL